MIDNPFTGAAFNKFLQEGRLMGTVCKACGTVHLPPRPICTHCGSAAMEWRELSGRGHLAAYSVIFIAPTAMINQGYNRANPFCAGIVQLEEGPSISAQIVGVDASHPETIAIGMPLTAIPLCEKGEPSTTGGHLGFKAGQP